MIVNSLMCTAHSIPLYSGELTYSCDREIDHIGLHHDFEQNMYWHQSKDAGGQPSGKLVFDAESYWNYYLGQGEPNMRDREPEECYA